MDKFYGDDINKIKEEYLLKATPFIRETRINFSGNLTPEIFFSSLYADKITDIDPRINIENEKFDQNIMENLNNINNNFAKVDLIHIAGYGGCGKTTYIRHLLWNLSKENKIENEIIDFEGAKRIVEPFVERISLQLCQDKEGIVLYIKDIINGKSFALNRFQDIMPYLSDLLSETDINNLNIEDIQAIILKQEKLFLSYDLYFYYLVTLDFLLQLYKVMQHRQKRTMIVVFDNVDSISILKEESTLVSVLKEFINDCNFFFGANVNNQKIYNNETVDNTISRTKFMFFLTTRMITIKKYLELEPDLEKVYGWISLRMPEHYYNHHAIVKRRVEFYEEMEGNRESKTIDNLKAISDFSNTFYRTSHFKRLFNGNIRFCFDTICKLRNLYSSTTLLKECDSLYKYVGQTSDVVEGINGIILNMLLNYFKDNGIYSEKLHLSECQCDKKISLSRIVLTVVREKGGACSVVELFKLLSPFNTLEDICDVLWDLSEAKRDYWRRLITFNAIIPKSLRELKIQMDNFKNGINDIERYSEINICISGCAYIDYVVPNFEFMLSRHKYDLSKLHERNYQPLFSDSSEDILCTKENVKKYRFEKKIDWVYKDVADCCVNSVYFAGLVMDIFKINKYEYINNTYFNYHSINRDGTPGIRQSYESRLIFSHIGYIERYRRYLLQKNKLQSQETLADINRRLVIRIKRYLDLYLDEEMCFHTCKQDEAAKELSTQLQQIQENNFKDFITKIEVRNYNIA